MSLLEKETDQLYQIRSSRNLWCYKRCDEYFFLILKWQSGVFTDLMYNLDIRFNFKLLLILIYQTNKFIHKSNILSPVHCLSHTLSHPTLLLNFCLLKGKKGEERESDEDERMGSNNNSNKTSAENVPKLELYIV